MNIREINLLVDANKTVDRLIDACRLRGPLSDANRNLVADVSRKAKLLKTALERLCEEVMPADKPSHISQGASNHARSSDPY